MAGNASRRQIDRDEMIYARCQVKPLLKRLKAVHFTVFFSHKKQHQSFVITKQHQPVYQPQKPLVEQLLNEYRFMLTRLLF
jgi:hypothetical protein